ncbi:hypothetical protein [Scytonema sp. NUACC21]
MHLRLGGLVGGAYERISWWALPIIRKNQLVGSAHPTKESAGGQCPFYERISWWAVPTLLRKNQNDRILPLNTYIHYRRLVNIFDTPNFL